MESTATDCKEPADNTFPLKGVHIAAGIGIVWLYGIAAEYGIAALLPWRIADWSSWKWHVLSSMSTGAIMISALLSALIFGLAAAFTGLRYKRAPRRGLRLYLLALIAIQILLVKDI